MSRIKLALIASLTATALVAGGRTPAKAATTAACRFEGYVDYINPAMQTVGGSGEFHFRSGSTTTSATPPVCSVDGGAPQPANITGWVSYSNVACGTFSGQGEMTISTATRVLTVPNFVFNFVALNGALRFGPGSTGAGEMSLQPIPRLPGPAPNPFVCATEFTFQGAFALSI